MQNVPLTRRQRAILEFFRGYREENGISPTLEEIAQHFHVSKVTVFGHVAELERKGVIKRYAKGISRGLQLVEPQASAGVSAPTAGEGRSLGPVGSPAVEGLAILGTIAAGAPIETLEEPELLPFADLAPPSKDLFVLRVRGNSMIEDAICDGDLVIVERRNDARDGQTVVAVLPGEEATLKRFYREPDGRLRLQPANAALQPTFVSEVELRGVVIGIVRRFDSR